MFEEVFPIQEVYRGDPEERTSHMNVPPRSAVLDCGAAKSLSGAGPAAMLAQACEKRCRKKPFLWNRRKGDHVIHQVASAWSSRRTRFA